MRKVKLSMIFLASFFLLNSTLIKSAHADIVQGWANISLSVNYYDLGQTFIADESNYDMILAWVEDVSATVPGQITMSLYDGSTLLTSQTITVPLGHDDWIALDVTGISFTIGHTYMFQLTETTYSWFARAHYEGYDGEDAYTDGTLVISQPDVSGTDPALYDLRFQIVSSPPSADVDISVDLEGSSRPIPSGLEVPITIGFFSPGADVMNDTPIYELSLTTSYSSGYAVCQCTGVAAGTYDITAVSDHTLMNVKRSMVISGPSTAVNMGTLLEGDCDDNGIIGLPDFNILKQDYFGPSSQADFDLNGTVGLPDFSLLKDNYFKTSPIEIP